MTDTPEPPGKPRWKSVRKERDGKFGIWEVKRVRRVRRSSAEMQKAKSEAGGGAERPPEPSRMDTLRKLAGESH